MRALHCSEVSSQNSLFAKLDRLMQHAFSTFKPPFIYPSPPALSSNGLREHESGLTAFLKRSNNKRERPCCNAHENIVFDMSSAHKTQHNPSHWPLRTKKLMDVDRPRFPPDLQTGDMEKRSINQTTSVTSSQRTKLARTHLSRLSSEQAPHLQSKSRQTRSSNWLPRA